MIRLSRVGRKNDPSFRVVVVDSKKKTKTGNYLENVGSYDSRSDRIDLKPERIKHWIAHGAQTSDTVHNLLVSQKIIDAKKINVLPSYAKAMEDKSTQTPAGEKAPIQAEVGAEVPEEATPAQEVDNAVAEDTPTQ